MFMRRIFFSMAKAISCLVLPIPSKIIFCGSTPASIALSNSPTDTTSAPAPKEAMSLMID